jgi:hypothetical protein
MTGGNPWKSVEKRDRWNKELGKGNEKIAAET